MTESTCCIIGHRRLDVTDVLKERLYVIFEELIGDGRIDTFLFGSRGEFDRLCYEIVTEIKKKRPEIRRVYVRSDYEEVDDDFLEYLLTYYEETYFPKGAASAGIAAYVERNRNMIDNSRICVFYYDPAYVPPAKKSRNRFLPDKPKKSGTKLAYDYAVRRKKIIINSACLPPDPQ